MRGLILVISLALSGCVLPVDYAARTCLAQALHVDPAEQPTTQGHDHAQVLMGDCMQARGYTFNWNIQRCDREYPRTIAKGGCYRRPE